METEEIVKMLQTMVDKKKAEPFLWESWHSMDKVCKNLPHVTLRIPALTLKVQKQGLFCSDLVISVLSVHLVLALGRHKVLDKNTIGKPIGALALAATAVSIYFSSYSGFIR